MNNSEEVLLEGHFNVTLKDDNGSLVETFCTLKVEGVPCRKIDGHPATITYPHPKQRGADIVISGRASVVGDELRFEEQAGEDRSSLEPEWIATIVAQEKLKDDVLYFTSVASDAQTPRHSGMYTHENAIQIAQLSKTSSPQNADVLQAKLNSLYSTGKPISIMVAKLNRPNVSDAS